MVLNSEGAEVRVNIVCLTGAILGIACVFLPWAVATLSLVGGGQAQVHQTGGVAPVDFLNSTLDQGLLDLMYAAILFTIGSALALLTPFGGIGQLTGIVVFGLRLKDSLSHLIPMPTTTLRPGLTWEYSSSLGPCFYLAILATTLTLASFVVSVRFDPSRKYWLKASLRMPIRERLLSIGADSKEGS
jgi:hypothetical protein